MTTAPDQRPPAISLRYADWPAADQRDWQRALRDGGLFDDRGPAAHWSARTRCSLQYDYGLWLRWCEQAGILLASSGCDRATPESVEGYLASLRARVSPVTQHGYLASLHGSLSVLYPTVDWHWLRELVNRLERLRVPVTDKIGRLQAGSALFSAGIALMESTPPRHPDTPRARQLAAAVQYRDGLMLALLAARPLRRSNFAAIEIGQQLRIIGQQPWLCFAEGETKHQRHLEQPFPAKLAPFLEVYLRTYRPLFPGADDHAYLWASAKGGQLKGDGLYQRIVRRTREAFGRHVNPHLFRDCAATTIARHTPAHVGIASQLLGHSRLDTTERHYNQAGSVSASHAYQATLAGLRLASAEGRND